MIYFYCYQIINFDLKPSIVGVEAVNCLLTGRDNVLVGIDGYRISIQPLMEMVKKVWIHNSSSI